MVGVGEQILANIWYLFQAVSASMHTTSQGQELNSFSQCLPLSEHPRNSFWMTWLPEISFMDLLILVNVVPAMAGQKRYACQFYRERKRAAGPPIQRLRWKHPALCFVRIFLAHLSELTENPSDHHPVLQIEGQWAVLLQEIIFGLTARFS